MVVVRRLVAKMVGVSPRLKRSPTSAASRHDHDGRDRDFWSGMTEILVSDGHIQKVFWR